MASNLIAYSGAKLAAVGAQWTPLSRLRSFTATAGHVLPVAGQGGASFPLRSTAAICVSPLPRRAKTGDAQEGSDKERDSIEVHNFLSFSADQAKYLILRISLPPEDETVAELTRHFSQLIATAKSEGDKIDRTAAVRGLIAGAYRLIELAYKSYKCPRLSARTTEEVFVDYFMNHGYKASEFEMPEGDQRYLGSMQASMNLAKTVVDCLRTEPYAILRMPPPR